MDLKGSKSFIVVAMMVAVLVVCSMTGQVEAVGKGCAKRSCSWSWPWREVKDDDDPCNTATTEKDGRTVLQGTYTCQLVRKGNFCCDPDCNYQACGQSCATLNMDGSWENIKAPLPCTIETTGKPPISGLQHFCCGKSS